MPPKKPVPVAIGETLMDGQLIRRVLSGEAALFEILVHRHSQRLYRTARAILRDDDEAADETFREMYANLPKDIQWTGCNRAD